MCGLGNEIPGSILCKRELRQDSVVRDLVFDIQTLISTLSKGMALIPGDIIATGTPAGVGIGFKPPKFLKKAGIARFPSTV